MKIWKVELGIGEQVIHIPEGSSFIHAREQHDHIVVWFECDPKEEKTPRKICVLPTGGDVGDAYVYIGTASLCNGSLIFHVYEDIS